MKILVTGASGYIGGTLAETLRDAGHSVTGLVRSEDKADFLRGRRMAAVVGTLDDAPVLAEAARAADVVVNTAEADRSDLVRNLVAALEGTGKGLIHTSGSSIVVDDAQGAVAGATVFADDDPYAAMPHRRDRIGVDTLVRTAGVTGGLRAAVICPTLIYGLGRGWKRDSHQIPLLAAKSRAVGAGVHVGEGRPIWSNVHLEDLMTLYVLAVEKAPSGAFFFAENGEASWRDIAVALGTALGFDGRTRTWPFDDAVAEIGGVARVALATNCRVRATNARRLLGWRPNRPDLARALTQEGAL